MQNRIKFLIGVTAFCFSLMVSATSVSLYPFTLQFSSVINHEYSRDRFHFKEVANAIHTMADGRVVNQEISVKPHTKRMEMNGRVFYATNIDGIGVALRVVEKEINAPQNQTQLIGRVSNQIPVSADLIIYDKLPSGFYQLPEQVVASLQFGADSYLMPFILLPTTIFIKQRTCELNEKNQTVKLNTVSSVDLINKGSEVYGGEFSLGLHCDPNVSAHVTFWDQSNVSNSSNVLSLDKRISTAEGIGLKLYKNNSDVVQFGLESLFSKNEEHPTRNFSVHYVNTNGKISAGSVNAIATVTFSYH